MQRERIMRAADVLEVGTDEAVRVSGDDSHTHSSCHFSIQARLMAFRTMSGQTTSSRRDRFGSTSSSDTGVLLVITSVTQNGTDVEFSLRATGVHP